MSYNVSSRYTNVKLAQGTAYVRRTPPASADKSTINGESVWVPAASSRHLTSLIMNIHNKSRARDVRWPGMRTELLWAPPDLSTDAVNQLYSFNNPIFLFPILVRPIVCVLHAKKGKLAYNMKNMKLWHGFCGYKKQWALTCRYMIMCRHCFLILCFWKYSGLQRKIQDPALLESHTGVITEKMNAWSQTS